MKKTATWLPIFSGFYNTIWDSLTDIDDDEIAYLNEQEEKKPKKQRRAITWDDLDIDYATADKDLSRQICDVIGNELVKLQLISKCEFEHLYSPKEYNYANDNIHCIFSFTKKNISNIKKYLKEHLKKWNLYLKQEYTSYDGFISFHDNFSDGEWSNIDICLEDKHDCSAILQFILLNEGYNENDVSNGIEFYINDYYIIKEKDLSL